MQECLRREEDSIKTTPITATAAVVTATPAPVVTATPAAVVSYNDLCFPKTSNYGSMKKKKIQRTNVGVECRLSQQNYA